MKNRAKKAANWLSSRFVKRGLILGYHRIAAVRQDPYNLCVTPQHFAEQLEVLSRHANPVSLEALVKGLRDGCLSQNSVVITLDDGYADNLYSAKPLIERYQLPATIFVATEYLGRQFWWDELESLLMSPTIMPERFALQINGFIYEWAAGNGAVLTMAKEKTRSRRNRLFWSIYHRLLTLPYKDIEEAIAKIRNLVKSELYGESYPRVLTADELIELAKSDLIEIGAHSQTHPILSELPLSLQQKEIQGSKTCLEKILRHPVTYFSYPHGSPSADTLAVVRDAGFFCACASSHGVAWRWSNLFNLPRFWIPDCDGKVFSRWLKKWLSN